MRESLFSSLKVVAMMLAIDNDLHPKERAWFIKVSKNFGASHSQRRTLESFLKGEHKEDLEAIIDGINDDYDQHRLLNFVQMAMRQDGIVKNSEIELFYEIHRLLNSRSTGADYRAWGRELRKRDQEIAFWKTLNTLGQIGSSKVRGFPFSGHIYLAPFNSDIDPDAIKNIALYTLSGVVVLSVLLIIICAIWLK